MPTGQDEMEGNAPLQASLKKPAWCTCSIVLPVVTLIWLLLSFADYKWTHRPLTDGKHFHKTDEVTTITYQWCMVGYFCNLLFTLPKLFFETNPSKLMLHALTTYISALSTTSYLMLWTGISPILVDVNSCLFIPQRWLLYLFTAPAILIILSQISNYTFNKRVYVIVIFEFTLLSGGLATIPWLSWNEKVFLYIVACLPFPEIIVHMWKMIDSAAKEADVASERFLHFIAILTEFSWFTFPVVYFASIAGLPVYISEPVWSLFDWLTKFAFASSLMEANFFTLEQRRTAIKLREEAQRNDVILQLSLAIERKDDFLSTMSHELRTPLNGIIGLSESLLAGGANNLPIKAHQTIKIVVLSAKRLLQLINDVLDAATLKQGTMIIKHEKVNIKKVVTDALDLCSPLIKKGVGLINRVGNNIPKIVGDTDRIAQILYNLLGNAAKFTASGTVTVTAGVSEDKDRVFISVADTGEGIPAQKLGRIFVAFEQVDMSTTRRHGGTGLGLHLVNELIKSHNGYIKVQSVLGKGSVFTVWLPVKQAGSFPHDSDMGGHLLEGEEGDDDSVDSDAGWGNDHGGADSNRGGILLSSDADGFQAVRPFHREVHGSPMVLSVDDDPINQMVVDNLLGPEGYTIEQAMDGMMALRFLATCELLPDVILLDVMMPGMSGYEVCSEIRRRFKSVFIPIIMVSAKASPEAVIQGLECGGVDYVKKPFHRKELLSRIRCQIRNREVLEAELASQRVNDNLRFLMPVSAIDRLQHGDKHIADTFSEVTVLFADLSNLLGSSPGTVNSTGEVIGSMNSVHQLFERMVRCNKVFRVEGNGDSYLVISGHDGAKGHTKKMVKLAQDMMQGAMDLKLNSGARPNVRIGLSCGPVSAGVVGIEFPRYFIYGEAVKEAIYLGTRAPMMTALASKAVAVKAVDQFTLYRCVHGKSTFILRGGDFKPALSCDAGNSAEKLLLIEDVDNNSGSIDSIQGTESTKLGIIVDTTNTALIQASSLALTIGDLCTDVPIQVEVKVDGHAITPDAQSALALAEAMLELAKKQTEVLRGQLVVASQDARRQQTEAGLIIQDLIMKIKASDEAAAKKSSDEAAARKPGMAAIQTRACSSVSSGTRASSASPMKPQQRMLSSETPIGAVSGLDHTTICNPSYMLEHMGGSSRPQRWPASMSTFLCFSDSVDVFLQYLSMEVYTGLLSKEGITPSMLATMTVQDVVTLGVGTAGACMQLLAAAKVYQEMVEGIARMAAFKDRMSSRHRERILIPNPGCETTP